MEINNVNPAAFRPFSRDITMERLNISKTPYSQQSDQFAENLAISTANGVSYEAFPLKPMTDELQSILEQYNINPKHTSSSEIYLYDFSSVADKENVDLGDGKVVSYIDLMGGQKFRLIQSDGTKLNLKFSEAENPKPFDATIFKNTVGKAFIMLANYESMAKNAGLEDVAAPGMCIKYDSSSRAIDLESISDYLLQQLDWNFEEISEKKSSLLINNSKYKEIYGELSSYYYDLIDEII